MVHTLTPEQEAKIPFYIDKWMKIGLECKPADPKVVEAIVKYYYERFEQTKPVPFVIVPTPKLAWKAACLATTDTKIEAKDLTAETLKLPGSVEVPSFLYPYIDGYYSCGYFAFYDFMLNYVKVEVSAELRRDYEWYLSVACIGLFYPLKHLVVISDKPKAIRIKNNTLHADGDAAIEYQDGSKEYYLNGVAVPEWLVMTPWKDLDARKGLKEANAEIRREFVRKAGIEKVCKDLKAKVVDVGVDHAGQPAELLQLDIGDGRKRPWIKLMNPSIGTYHIEGVKPEIKTVKEALAWRNGGMEEPEIVT